MRSYTVARAAHGLYTYLSLSLELGGALDTVDNT
jgi:hypothetical protein